MQLTIRPAAAVIAAVATATLGVVTAPTAANAGSANWHKNLSQSVLAPFQLAVNQQKVYATDGFTGVISRVDAEAAPLATGIPGVAGLDYTADGKTYAYTWSNDDHTEAGLTIRTKGRPDVVADIAAYEASHNPDHVNTYGIIAGGNACAEGILGQLTGGSATYTGVLDTHPYSVARVGKHWVVADAGANALLSVTDQGVVSTLKVMPPQPVTLTQDMVDGLAASMGAPAGAFDCLVGVTYAFEPVPTDVEVAPTGELWTSLLPGGPEGPSLGARGAVYTVNATTGRLDRVAGGFLGATNLAVAADGTVYVAELFGGKISTIRNGTVSTFREVERPLALEVHGGYLYASTMADLEFTEQGPVVHGFGSVERFKR